MSEPCRLLEDDTSELERALLQAGASYRCSDYQREKVLAGLGLVGAAGFGSAAATFSLRHLLDAGPIPWIAGLSVIGLAAAVPVSMMLGRAEPSDLAMPRVMPALTAMQVRTPLMESEGIAKRSGASVSAGERELPSGVSRAASTRSRSTPQGATQRKSAGLAEELRALDEVRSLLGTGQASAALARIDAYSREYPAGRLGLEAEVLRIDALARSGNAAAAEQRAAAFLRQHPKSVLAPRVRRHLRK